MFGLLWLIILGIGWLVFSYRNAVEDNHSKQKAKNENQKYYLDWQGKKRRIDNNHKVLQHVTDYRTGDKVDLDMDTNEVLRNYSQENREQQSKKEQEWLIEGKKNKEKAIAEQKYFYSMRVYDPNNNITHSKYIWKRVSDDLEIDTVSLDDYGHMLRNKSYGDRYICIDTVYGLRLYELNPQYRNANKFIIQDDKYNRWLCNYLANEKNIGKTENELIQYAKKIDAILIYGGNISE